MVVAGVGTRSCWFWPWLHLCLAGSFLLAASSVLAVIAADPLLVVRTGIARADVIVVLGGDGPRRARHAAVLFQAGFAPRVLISGDGDCDDIRRLMIGAGVPSEAIVVECESRTTVENAEFSAPILAAMGVHSSLLVTSWFHTRRAIGCFRKAAPRIYWMSAPVERGEPLWRLLWDVESIQIAKEYEKIAWYAVHYGVPLYPKSDEMRGAQP